MEAAANGYCPKAQRETSNGCFVRTNTQTLSTDDAKREEKLFDRSWDRNVTFLHKMFCCSSVLLD